MTNELTNLEKRRIELTKKNNILSCPCGLKTVNFMIMAFHLCPLEDNAKEYGY